MLQKLRRIKQFSFLMHVVSPFKLTIGKHSKSAPIVSTWVPLKLYGMLNSLCREKPLYFGLSELNAESKKIVLSSVLMFLMRNVIDSSKVLFEVL